jgi:hypothetical protein
MTALPETFRCTPLACTLTRSSCAARHERANRDGRAGQERLHGGAACVTCEVGAAHARGERPDVSIASLTARREDDEMPKATVIEHEGVTKTLGEWARDAGLDTQTLRDRLKNKWPMATALSRPVMSPQESGALSRGRGGKAKGLGPVAHIDPANAIDLSSLPRTSGSFDPAAQAEKVDHPAHYGGADNPYEAIKVIRAWGAGFAIGSALKYLARAGKKPGESTLDDLRKAAWYIQSEIAAIEARS